MTNLLECRGVTPFLNGGQLTLGRNSYTVYSKLQKKQFREHIIDKISPRRMGAARGYIGGR